ncbi:hypothetical protein AVEN_88191-1 [Araneus ventricosus]|uniref:Uncharacterized protein n=1 Tax=Araneus ventricosus TaxID=182803 RepID=A0A4Y2MVV1_ARAVE|nr:hypothetical protein AVEN_41594-1 [Araneus ventricosus]GBN29776.1 hypothetical protein AVEN_88191-1 [Araneus ventricosus]
MDDIVDAITGCCCVGTQKTQFNIISFTNGWTDLIKVSQLVASLRGSAAEALQGIPPERLTDLVTIENALESRFGDSHLTQFYRTELKTRRQKPGESLKVLAADVERLMSLAYAECPLDVRESLAAQYFVDAIRDEDTQHSTRLMDAKDLKSALVYSMKYEVARTMSKTCSHVRSMEIEDSRIENEVINFNLYLTGWKNYLTVVLLERGTLLDETRTRLSGGATKRGTYRGSARQLFPTRKTNLRPSCRANAAFSE